MYVRKCDVKHDFVFCALIHVFYTNGKSAPHLMGRWKRRASRWEEFVYLGVNIEILVSRSKDAISK